MKNKIFTTKSTKNAKLGIRTVKLPALNFVNFVSLVVKIFLFILLIGINNIQAQINNGKTGGAQREDEVIRIKSDLVSFEVSVRDGQGAPIRDLKREDFVIFDNNRRQQISHLTALEAPFDLVLILDTSLSTEQNIELMREAARNFIAEIGAQDRVAVVQFNHDVELINDFTNNHAKLNSALDRVGRGSQQLGSSVYDALILAVGNELLNKSKGRKAVLMLSDGVDSSSITAYETIKQALEQSGAGFYFIELDTEKYTEAGVVRERTDPERLTFSRAQLQKYFRAFKKDRFEEYRYNNHYMLTAAERREVNRGLYSLARQELRELARRTGGEVFPARRLEELSGAYHEVIVRLRTLYSIGYYPEREPDGRWHDLRVETKVPGAQLKYRTGYWAITQ